MILKACLDSVRRNRARQRTSRLATGRFQSIESDRLPCTQSGQEALSKQAPALTLFVEKKLEAFGLMRYVFDKNGLCVKWMRRSG